MSVHYKFKAALDFSTVTFDGIHISVSELKKSIIDQKRLGKNADFDLQIINAQTKEVYNDENALIPKNTSVIVARVPITDKKKSAPPLSSKDGPGGRGMHQKGMFHQQSGAEVAKGSDLSTMDMTEEEKIKAMMTQSTQDYDPSHYVRIRGANQHGRVPDNYRCNKCNQGGHWINRCPNVAAQAPDLKKSTGIPRSFMVVVDSPDFPGALMTPEGRYAVPAVDHAAYLEKGKGQQTVEQPVKPKIPDDLVCPLCSDLLTDALLVPCCANSYCDDCIRSYLLESDHECPGCHEKDISPTSLIPNRFLRGTVNAFKSDTGYSKPEKIPERPPKSPPKEQIKTNEPRKLSLDELPDDLFPHSPKKIDSEGEGGQATDADSNKVDLYDFNDGSIPSPFASPKRTEAKADGPGEQRAIQSLGRPFPTGPPPGMMRGPGPGGPPQSHNHPPHHMSRKPPSGPMNSNAVEPPPPGFDVLPPGEDSSHNNRPPHGSNGSSSSGGPSIHDGKREGGGPPPNRGPGPPPNQQQQQPPQQTLLPLPPNVPPPSFNPMQPPPGYPGPSQHGPPGGAPGPPGPGHPPGLPPPGFGPPGPGGPPPHGPNQNMPPYQNNFNRLPPMNRGPPPMHHGGPPPRHHMDHHDDFGHRGRGRRPYGGPIGRMDEQPHREDESRLGGVGTIEDPLKEFERIMREKDRRKKLAASGARKRSKSRSFSPPPRRTSPYPPKRSRSRSFSRSPSPKRKRPPPGTKRRRSYSRSLSRSPPPLGRRITKSSVEPRSRSRNRSPNSPTPPGKLRRSPRRAPPFSPSPPPSRFGSRKDKDEYFENRGRDRYDERPPPRFQNKPYNAREYEGKYDAPSSKYENPMASKHDTQGGSHKYEPQRQPTRPYHGHNMGHGMPHDAPSSYRDKPPVETKRPYEYESNIVPPGTENVIQTVPSLLDINVQPHQNNPNVYPISTIGTHSVHTHGHEGSSRETSELDKSRRAVPETAPVVSEKKKPDEDIVKELDGDKERRKKSPLGKKHKKEKKKHKKKSKEEKKGKKTRKSKDDKTTEGDKSSDDEPETETSHEKASLTPVEEGKLLPIIGVLDTSIDSIAKQTAPCDSTVKSPDRLHESEAAVKEEANTAIDKTAQPLTQPVKRRASLATVSQVIGHEVPDHKNPDNTAKAPLQKELHLPPSKWDEYEDFMLGGEALKPAPAEHDIPSIVEPVRDSRERIVTSDVIKRAEHAIFEKPSKAITEPLEVATRKPLTPPETKELTVREPRKYDKSYREDIPIQSSVVQQLKPDLKTSSSSSSLVASTVYRKSAKDRLGSKLSEDEVLLNVGKTVDAVSLRSKVSAVRDSSDGTRKRRSRSRSPAFASSRYRNRSRSRSIDRHRNRSRHSAERQKQPEKETRRSPVRKVSPIRRDKERQERRRSPSRDRRRSPSREKISDSKNVQENRERRRSPSRERRRSVSRERKRSPSKERRRTRSRERERERDKRRSNSRSRRRSKSRERIERRRSRSRERRRSGSRERRRSRSAERRRSPSRERRRSVSRDRDNYRTRQRSPFRRPDISKGKDDLREETNRRNLEPSEKIRLNLLEERKEPNLPRSTDNSSTALKVEEPSSPEARVFQQAGSALSRSDQIFSPTLKKQKGRINIKLSSISKAEQQQSGSSSSDEEHDPQAAESKHSDSGDEKRKKRRRHSSTSTKSSSSSDTKRKKKKKDKKKKKKKKKSK